MKKVVDLPEKHGRLGDLDELYNRIDGFVKHYQPLIDDNAQPVIDAILNSIKESDTLVESSDKLGGIKEIDDEERDR